jgi:signal transduction histidine kinase
MFNEIVDDAVSRLEGGIRKAGVMLHIQKDMPKVTVDTMRFSEVIQNLVENSIKFTKDREKPEIRIGFRQENGRGIFFVNDNGIGIEGEYRERVFGLFEQLDHKNGGTGIGLAIIKRIIENHGGVIWIEDGENGQGASFCFTIHEDTNKKES